MPESLTATEVLRRSEPYPQDRATTPNPSAFQRFVTTYSTFLSSFVVGAAGLIATTLYQTKQQDITRRQAEAQISISQVAAENQWRIERAEILSKNLDVLSSNREETIDRRYGVLLSLTRGKIIDAELAMSYALELGRYNPGYMRSVLDTVEDKNYFQLDRSYLVGCEQRYGLSRNVGLCSNDRYGLRSQAIADVITDDVGTGNLRPLVLLADEKQVREALQRRTWLFATYLAGLYERRQVHDIERFEAASPGARLVAALVLSLDRDGELEVDEELGEQMRFREARQKWLETYLLDRHCDPDCKGHLADFMLTDLGAGAGAHASALRALMERPSAESTHARSRLHARLLWCRATDEAITRLRDQVLVPAAMGALGQQQPAQVERLKALLELIALVPLPARNERDAWYGLLDGVRRQYPRIWLDYLMRRQAAESQRSSPPRPLAQGNFCGMGEVLSAGLEHE